MFIFVPIYLQGMVGHLLGLVFMWTVTKSFPKTIKIWITAIALSDLSDLFFGGLRTIFNTSRIPTQSVVIGPR